MTLYEYAENELKYTFGDDPDEMQAMMNKSILDIVKVFSDQGFSGFSAPYAINILTKLLNYKPLSPLEGTEDEWFDIDDPSTRNMQQNKRCFSVFRYDGDNSTAEMSDAKVFSDDGGESYYTSKDSFIPVVFPFTVPEKEFVYLDPEN